MQHEMFTCGYNICTSRVGVKYIAIVLIAIKYSFFEVIAIQLYLCDLNLSICNGFKSTKF